jgi:hypothetical protein
MNHVGVNTEEAPVVTESTTHPLHDVIPPLTARDRCCSCGAQAYVAVLLTIDNDHPLLFCGHHGRTHLPAIMTRKPFAVRDDIAILHTSEIAKASSTHTS